MTPSSLPDPNRSGIAAVTADTSTLPITERDRDVRVSFFPGADIEVTVIVGGKADAAVFTDEAHARSLYRCLDKLFGPLAETRAAVRSSVALAGGPR